MRFYESDSLEHIGFDFYCDIANNIVKARKEKGITIMQLEQELEFPRSYICKWNNNEPGIRKVQKVADYLGVPIEKLLEERG